MAEESVNYIVCECPLLAYREYKVDTMVFQKQFIGYCAENMAYNVLTKGMRMFLEKLKSLWELRSLGIFTYRLITRSNITGLTCSW